MEINSITFKLSIFQAYVPTREYDDEGIKQFYRNIKTVLKHKKKEESTMMMGDERQSSE